MVNLTIRKLQWGVLAILVLLPITLQAQHLNNPSKQGKTLIQKQGLNQLQLPAQALQRIREVLNRN